MAQKLLSLEEAARFLSVSVEEVNRLREGRELNGLRDGTSWKFKEADVQRVRDARGGPPTAASEDEFDLAFGIDDDAESADVILVSDRESGGSSHGSSSTVIGKPGQGQSPESSDIELITSEDVLGGSDVKLVPDAAEASGLKLQTEIPGTDPASVFEEDLGQFPDLADDEESDIEFDIENSKLPLAAESASAPGSDVSLDEGSLDLALGNELDFGDDIALTTGAKAGKSPGSSDVHDDLDLGLGSDVTRSPGDSGISLANPADSGLSLEEPLKLDAPSDDIDLEFEGSKALQLDDDSDSQEVGELPVEDDNFLLTPLEDMAEADSEDSGSQVIDIAEDSGFGADVAGGVGGGLLEESMLGGAVAAGPTSGLSTGGAQLAAAREAQYSTLQVASLCMCMLTVGISSMLTYDLARQIWSWDQPFSLSSMLMDLIVSR